jgi:hypothetical protein
MAGILVSEWGDQRIKMVKTDYQCRGGGAGERVNEREVNYHPAVLDKCTVLSSGQIEGNIKKQFCWIGPYTKNPSET